MFTRAGIRALMYLLPVMRASMSSGWIWLADFRGNERGGIALSVVIGAKRTG